MTKQIDHVAEARSLIRGALTDLRHGKHHRANLCAALSQTEATLALVEQQRIQNVFYLAREVHADIIAGLDELGVNSHEIAAALGIQEVQS